MDNSQHVAPPSSSSANIHATAASGTRGEVPAMPKPNFLQKNSLLYLFYAGSLAVIITWIGGYDFYVIGREHYEELRPNLREPWAPFKWMGSRGVDVADLQWYYFILALPPTIPILILFLVLSTKLKERSPPVVMPFSPAAATAAAAVSKGSPTRHAEGKTAGRWEVPGAPRTAERNPFRQNTLDPGEGAAQGARAGSGSTSESTARGNGESNAVMGRENSGSALQNPYHAHGAAGEAGTATAMSLSMDGSGSHRYLYFGKNLTAVYLVHIAFGVVIAALITGPGFLFGTALMLLNYYLIVPLQRRFSFRFAMAVMWVSHIAILFINFHADGYRFAWFGLSFLDHLYSPLMRWNVHYNMTLLRMIAFNNDYWEANMHDEERRERAISKHFRCCAACAVLRDTHRHISPTGGQAESLRCYKCRTECPRPLEEYNVLSYLAFLFYPPLFIAGPMASFNGYVSHLHFPTRAVVGKALWRYGLRFFFNAIGLAAMMHYVWITALLYTQPSDLAKNPVEVERRWGAAAAAASSASAAGSNATTTTASLAAEAARINNQPVPSVFQQLDYVSKAKLLYLFLCFMWYKFNVFWKFFRFFALLDGMDPPEDMKRCFSNTVNIQGFWRDWHASFNLWIVRYMYIPMGGRQRIKFSIFPIFFFIAIWHDIEMRLLFWALFMCVFMVPEIAVTATFASRRNPTVLKIKRNVGLYRFLRVVATAFNMLLLIVVNLIGFSIGMSGAESEISNMLNQMSVKFVLGSVFLFFSAANIAIQSRDQEAYENQVLKLKYDLQSR